MTMSTQPSQCSWESEAIRHEGERTAAPSLEYGDAGDKIKAIVDVIFNILGTKTLIWNRKWEAQTVTRSAARWCRNLFTQSLKLTRGKLKIA